MFVQANHFIRRALLIVILLAVLARGMAAFALGDQVEPLSGAWDQVSYDTLAQRVLEGHGFSFPTGWYPFTLANEQTSHWSFLYTLFLSGVYAIFGHHPLVARLIQVCVSALNCYLAYRIGRRLFNDWSGLAAAALTAGYAYFIFFNAALMTQTFYIVCVLLAIEFTLDLAEHQTRRGWLLLGLALGLGTLFRQTLLLFTPFLLGWLVWRWGRRVRWGDIVLTLIIIGLLIAPWTVRNYLVYHDFMLLNSNGGYWLFASNHPNQGTNFNQNYVVPLPESLRGLPEPAIDRALYNMAIGFIVSDPTRFALLTLSRIPNYFSTLPSEQSSFTSNLSRIFSFTLYLPFMVAGLWLSRRNWRACLPLYLYLAFDTSLHLISWAAPRYRLPSDALLMSFAGFAVVSLAERFGPFTRLMRPSTVSKGVGE